MKTFLIIFLAICLVPIIQGWTSISERDEEKLKGHPNKCYFEGVGYMDVKESKRVPNECMKVTCGKRGDVELTGCTMMKVPPPCKVVPGDLSKPYPDCCHEKVCP